MYVHRLYLLVRQTPKRKSGCIYIQWHQMVKHLGIDAMFDDVGTCHHVILHWLSQVMVAHPSNNMCGKCQNLMAATCLSNNNRDNVDLTTKWQKLHTCELHLLIFHISFRHDLGHPQYSQVSESLHTRPWTHAFQLKDGRRIELERQLIITNRRRGELLRIELERRPTITGEGNYYGQKNTYKQFSRHRDVLCGGIRQVRRQ